MSAPASMSAIRVATRDGGLTTLSAGEVSALASALRGTLVTQRCEGYEAARGVWNAAIASRPSLIVRCRGVADVLAVVRLVARRGLRCSVRGGGHNIAGSALCEAGLVIDLSPMRAIRVDPTARTVRVEPGVCWGELDRETQAFGLATPGGVVSTTGVAGLTLGGGIGWLSRPLGLSCDNLRAVDLVTADGELRQVDAGRDPELFWALRGMGGNFGVVTSFELALHPVGPEILGGEVMYPMERAGEVIDAFRALCAASPETLGAELVLATLPDVAAVPAAVRGRRVACIGVCWLGEQRDEGESLVAPLRRVGGRPPLLDAIGMLPFVAQQKMYDPGQPPGRHAYWKSQMMSARAFDATAGATLVRHAEAMTSPYSSLIVMHLGGAVARVPIEQTAVAGLRDAEFIVICAAAWDGAAESARHIAWAREAWRGMQPHGAGGGYVNFDIEEDDQARLRADLGSRWQRLLALKHRVDPDDLFHMHRGLAEAQTRSDRAAE